MALEITRGTTPQIVANIPSTIALANVAQAWVSMGQGSTVITKTYTDGDVAFGTSSVMATFTQADTLALTAGEATTVQIRLLMNTGIALASQTEYIDVLDVVRDGEIS